MACRSGSRTQDAIDSIKQKTEGVENVGELVFKHLELSFLASVRKCAKEILYTEKRIDMLVNNAGELSLTSDMPFFKIIIFLF